MSESQRKTWTYPGALGHIRLLSFVPLVIGAIVDDWAWTWFGIGWWIACLVCEFAWHRAEKKVIRWEDVTPELLEDAWLRKLTHARRVEEPGSSPVSRGPFGV